MVMQQKTKQPVQFEINEQNRDSIAKWIEEVNLTNEDYQFRSRVKESPHISPRQYARIVEQRVAQFGLDPSAHGTHSMRRTKAAFWHDRLSQSHWSPRHRGYRYRNALVAIC